jgi:PTH1 family peptidyl-tRNA hydrolase
LKAIIGLGNPGPRFHGTRHNVGFAVLDELAQRARVSFESAPVDALAARWRRPGGSSDGIEIVVLLAKPMTFMNASGEAVGGLLRYFKIDAADLLVVVDEVHLPLGKLRARARGSAGGHNGLKSVIAHVGQEFSRLRLGVGRGPEIEGGRAQRDLADHVLSRFDVDERAEVDRMIARATDAAEMFVTGGIAEVMNGFNGGDPATTE